MIHARPCLEPGSEWRYKLNNEEYPTTVSILTPAKPGEACLLAGRLRTGYSRWG